METGRTGCIAATRGRLWPGFQRATLLAAAGMAAAAGLPMQAQQPDATASLQFEVAAFKHSAPDDTRPGLIKRLPGDRGYSGVNMPLEAYIRVAYQLRTSQISGPDWLTSENYDMEAKAERPSTPDELHAMLQHLLEERLHIRLHRETREQSGYALMVDKGGHKLTDHDVEDKILLPIRQGPGMHDCKNVTIPYFVFYLSAELDHTVIDKTGLDGHYDFKVQWGFDDAGMARLMPPGPPGAAGDMNMVAAQLPSGPTIFEALRQQLGLRLEPAKVPVEHLVIDHIEKLTEN